MSEMVVKFTNDADKETFVRGFYEIGHGETVVGTRVWHEPEFVEVKDVVRSDGERARLLAAAGALENERWRT